MIKKITPIVLLIISVLIFFPKVVFLGHTFFSSGLIQSDLFASNYPSKELLHRSFSQHQGIPFWTDNISDGFPYFAEGGLAALYPLNQVFFRLPIPTITAFNWILLIQFMIAAVGTYLYTQSILKLRTHSSLLGSLVYTFCGALLMRIQHTNIVLIVTYFPLFLLTIDKIISWKESENKFKLAWYFLCFTIVLFLQLSVGSLEFSYYSLLFGGVYLILRLFFNKQFIENFKIKAVTFCIGITIACILVLPQILSTVELTLQSQRVGGVTTEESAIEEWPVQSLIFFINPKAYPLYADRIYTKIQGQTVNIKSIYPYLGILPLILGFYAIISIFKKGVQGEKRRWIFVYLSLLTLTYIYAVGSSTQVYTLIRETIPGLKFFRLPLKSLFVIEFSIAMLASIGLDQFIENKRNVNQMTIVGMIILAISYGDLFINNSSVIPTINASRWLEMPESAKYIQSKYPNTQFHEWRVYSAGVDILGNNQVLNQDLQYGFKNLIYQDFNMIYNIDSSQGYTGLFIKRHHDLNSNHLIIDFKNSQIKFPDTMKKSLDLQSTKYILSDIPVNNADLSLVKTFPYRLKYKHRIPTSENENSYIESDKVYLYENNTFIPRIQILPENSAHFETDSDKVLKTLLSNEFDAKTQILLETAKINKSKDTITYNYQASYAVRNYTPQDMTFQIESSTASYFIMSDTYYPGWHASLNTKEVPIIKANYNFRAVSIPKGKHLLRFYFEPTYWKGGVIAALVGFSFLVTYSVYLFFNIKSKNTINK